VLIQVAGTRSAMEHHRAARQTHSFGGEHWLEALMPLHLSNYSYGSKRRRGEGLRLGCARYLPRGVRKEDYAATDMMDVWLPTVAPSRELLSWARKNNLDDSKTWDAYARRYRAEMKKTDARQTIRALAELAKRTAISVGCYCHGPHCHRFELEKLIRAAGSENPFEPESP
jgi:uncharacterized protein YeaO (DUF488 family)